MSLRDTFEWQKNWNQNSQKTRQKSTHSNLVETTVIRISYSSSASENGNKWRKKGREREGSEGQREVGSTWGHWPRGRGRMGPSSLKLSSLWHNSSWGEAAEWGNWSTADSPGQRPCCPCQPGPPANHSAQIMNALRWEGGENTWNLATLMSEPASWRATSSKDSSRAWQWGHQGA